MFFSHPRAAYSSENLFHSLPILSQRLQKSSKRLVDEGIARLKALGSIVCSTGEYHKR